MTVAVLARQRAALGFAALFLLLHLPFVSKPLHMDDWTFVEIARQIQEHPLEPYDFTLENAGREWSVREGMTRPPGWGYFVATAFWLAGESTQALHLLVFAFSAIALLSMASLARNLGLDPLAAALCLLVSPVYLVMAHSGMADVPTLALILASVALYVAAIRRDSVGLATCGGALGTVACLFSYQGLLLPPLVALWAALHRRWRIAALGALPMLGFALWFLENLVRAGEISLLAARAAGATIVVLGVPNRIVYALSTLGLGFVPLLFGATLLVRGRGAILGVLGGVVGAVVGWSAGGAMPSSSRGLLAIAVGLGLAALVRATVGLVREKAGTDSLALLAWTWGALFAVVVCFLFGSARYLLVVAPPLILAALRLLQSERRLGRVALVAGGALAAVLALTVAVADYGLALSYRDVSRRIERRDSGEIFSAAPFAMHFWMKEAGFPSLRLDDRRPVVGDRIVRAWNNSPGLDWYYSGFPLANGHFLRIHSQRRVAPWIPVQSYNYWAHAGFYFSGYGLLPFSFGWQDWERFETYDVVTPNPLLRALAQSDGHEIRDGDVRLQTWLLEDGGHAVLFAHPPSSIGYDWPDQRAGRLRGAVGLSPELAQARGVSDGVEFLLYTVGVTGVEELRLRLRSTGSGVAHGFDLEIEAGSVSELRLVTSAAGSSDYDWAGWIDLEFIPEPGEGASGAGPGATRAGSPGASR